jgi:hypothetical protein
MSQMDADEVARASQIPMGNDQPRTEGIFRKNSEAGNTDLR